MWKLFNCVYWNTSVFVWFAVLARLVSDLQAFLLVLDSENLSYIAQAQKKSITELLYKLQDNKDAPGDRLIIWSKCVILHANMHYCWNGNISSNISEYYQCWKQLSCLLFLWKLWYYCFRILWWIESSKEQHLFEIRIHHINVFTVTLIKFNLFKSI